MSRPKKQKDTAEKVENAKTILGRPALEWLSERREHISDFEACFVEGQEFGLVELMPRHCEAENHEYLYHVDPLSKDAPESPHDHICKCDPVLIYLDENLNAVWLHRSMDH